MHRFALFVCAFALLAGCQRPQNSETAAKPGQKIKIVFIPKNEGNPYFEDAQKGFEDAAKELGMAAISVGPAAAEPTSQIPVIKQQIQNQVDVIAISPNSPDALNPVLDEAKAKGILVITVDADLAKNESHRAAAVLTPDSKQIGEGQVELLGSEIGYEGEIAILSATKDAPNQNAWIAVMQETLKQPKYAKMKLDEIVYGDDERQKSLTEAEGLLTKYPNLRGIISPTTVGVAAAAQALEVSGKYPGGPHASGPGVELTGLGTPDQMRGFIEKGVVKAVQLWSPHDMGYMAAYLIHAIKTGQTKGPGDSFTAGKLGEHKIGDLGIVYSGPMVTFDKSTVGNYHF